MEKLFLTIVQMSITASYAILFVIFARLLLKRAPKAFSYSLWAVVFFRLVCPVSFSSTFSFFKTLGQRPYIPSDIGMMPQPKISVGSGSLDSIVNRALPAATPIASVNPMQVIVFIASVIWIVGMLSLVIYSIVSYLLFKRRVQTAIRVHGAIYESDRIESPFVLGIIKPKIYLPMGLLDAERGYIVRHEETHIRRRDYLIKPIAYLVLCIHWFNPLVWLSFILMSRDMEMSCDERVLREMGSDIKMDYSASLLSLAVGRRMVCGSPLAFGESNVKSRIRNVLHYKRPAFWVVVIAVLAVGVFCLGLLSNPKSHAEAKKDAVSQLYSYRTEYVGNHVKVGHIVGQLQVSDTLKDGRIQLHTSKKPYAVSVFYKTTPEAVKEKLSYQERFDHYAVIMFSLIENMDKVEFVLEDGTESRVFEHTRAWANEKIAQDVWAAAETEEKFRMLYENLMGTMVYRGEVKPQAASIVEKNLTAILSSPLESSNPNDYMREHWEAYENILKLGDDALSYLLDQFAQGKDAGLRGQIMMRLCKEMLGARNNVTDDSLSPQEWYQKLSVRQEIPLPDFVYRGHDPIERLVYETETAQTKGYRGGFVIVAPHIFESFEEGDRLKVFVTTYAKKYKLFDKFLFNEEGSAIPAAITYRKAEDGSYVLETYESAQDGTYYAPSIREFCTMPVSHKKIKGLAEKILRHYRDYQDIIRLERENLITHLRENGMTGVSLYQSQDKVVPIT